LFLKKNLKTDLARLITLCPSIKKKIWFAIRWCIRFQMPLFFGTTGPKRLSVYLSVSLFSFTSNAASFFPEEKVKKPLKKIS